MLREKNNFRNLTTISYLGQVRAPIILLRVKSSCQRDDDGDAVTISHQFVFKVHKTAQEAVCKSFYR